MNVESDDEMLRIIANPRRLKPEIQTFSIQPTFQTKLLYFLRDVYPELYISDSLLDRVSNDIEKHIKDEVTESLVNDFVDTTIQRVLEQL